MSHLTLEETKVYNDAVAFAELIWEDVAAWNQFERDTVGNQLVRAADSIGANTAEGYGRFHFAERIHFLYYARGSSMNVNIGSLSLKNENSSRPKLRVNE